MKKQVVNCETGDVKIVECSPEEEALLIEQSSLTLEQTPKGEE